MDRNAVLSYYQDKFSIVALRKESVDRNADGVVSGSADYVSLSARRAWIEIAKSTPEEAYKWSRSPQGERG